MQLALKMDFGYVRNFSNNNSSCLYYYYVYDSHCRQRLFWKESFPVRLLIKEVSI